MLGPMGNHRCGLQNSHPGLPIGSYVQTGLLSGDMDNLSIGKYIGIILGGSELQELIAGQISLAQLQFRQLLELSLEVPAG